jgi:DNA-directed RNA polymerase sigma subunit (sigma70/sigma32)
VETLRKAIEWRRQLHAGEVPNQAAIARREGITRARVTQVLALLQLPTEIRRDIMAAQDDSPRRCLSEHALRRIATVRDATKQVAIFSSFARSRQKVATAP